MTTFAENTFKRMVKEAFQAVLKPLGFKKKGNNFYQFTNDIGHLVSLQRSMHNSDEEIRFTANIGVFLPEYWFDQYNYNNEPTAPDFPKETECLLRERIGILVSGKDDWYELHRQCDANALIIEATAHLHQAVLPFFERFSSRQKLLDEITNASPPILHDFDLMRVLGVFGKKDLAIACYQHIISKPNIHEGYKKNVEEHAHKYKLFE